MFPELFTVTTDSWKSSGNPWADLGISGYLWVLVKIHCHSECSRICIILPPSSGSAPGLLPSGSCPESFQNQAYRRHPMEMPEPTQLTPFNERRIGSTPGYPQMMELLPLFQQLSAEPPYKISSPQLLVSRISFFLSKFKPHDHE